MKDLLANRLREAMKAKGMKQIDLAVATGIDKSQIHHYVNGNYEPKNENLRLISTALSVSSAWLMGYDDGNNENAPVDKLNSNITRELRSRIKDKRLE